MGKKGRNKNKGVEPQEEMADLGLDTEQAEQNKFNQENELGAEISPEEVEDVAEQAKDKINQEADKFKQEIEEARDVIQQTGDKEKYPSELEELNELEMQANNLVEDVKKRIKTEAEMDKFYQEEMSELENKAQNGGEEIFKHFLFMSPYTPSTYSGVLKELKREVRDLGLMSEDDSLPEPVKQSLFERLGRFKARVKWLQENKDRYDKSRKEYLEGKRVEGASEKKDEAKEKVDDMEQKLNKIRNYKTYQKEYQRVLEEIEADPVKFFAEFSAEGENEGVDFSEWMAHIKNIQIPSILDKVRTAKPKEMKKIAVALAFYEAALSWLENNKDKKEAEEGQYFDEIPLEEEEAKSYASQIGEMASLGLGQNEESREAEQMDKIKSGIESFVRSVSLSDLKDNPTKIKEGIENIVKEYTKDILHLTESRVKNLTENYYSQVLLKLEEILQIKLAQLEEEERNSGWQRIKSHLKEVGKGAKGAAVYNLLMRGAMTAVRAVTGMAGTALGVTVGGVVGGAAVIVDDFTSGRFRVMEKIFSRSKEKKIKNLIAALEKKEAEQRELQELVRQELAIDLQSLIEYDTNKVEEVKYFSELNERCEYSGDEQAVKAKQKKISELLNLQREAKFYQNEKLAMKDFAKKKQELIGDLIKNGTLDEFITYIIKEKLSQVEAETGELSAEQKRALLREINLQVEMQITSLLGDLVAQEKFDQISAGDKKSFLESYRAKILEQIPPESLVARVIKGSAIGAGISLAYTIEPQAAALYMGLRRFLSSLRAESLRDRKQAIKDLKQKRIDLIVELSKIDNEEGKKKLNDLLKEIDAKIAELGGDTVKTAAQLENDLEKFLQREKLDEDEVKDLITEIRARIKLPDIKEVDRVRLENKIRQLQDKLRQQVRQEILSRVEMEEGGEMELDQKIEMVAGKILEQRKAELEKAADLAKENKQLNKMFGKKGWGAHLVRLFREDKKKFFKIFGKSVGRAVERGLVAGLTAGGINAAFAGSMDMDAILARSIDKATVHATDLEGSLLEHRLAEVGVDLNDGLDQGELDAILHSPDLSDSARSQILNSLLKEELIVWDEERSRFVLPEETEETFELVDDSEENITTAAADTARAGSAASADSLRATTGVDSTAAAADSAHTVPAEADSTESAESPVEEVIETPDGQKVDIDQYLEQELKVEEITPETLETIKADPNADKILEHLFEEGEVVKLGDEYFTPEFAGVDLTDGLDKGEYMKLLDEIDRGGEHQAEARELFQALLKNPDTSEQASLYLSTVNQGQGVTHALVRQFKLNPELAAKAGLSEQDLNNDLKLALAARQLAEEQGYIKYDEDKIDQFIEQLKQHPDQYDKLPDDIKQIEDPVERAQAIERWAEGHRYTVARDAGAVTETWIKDQDIAGYKLEVGDDGKLHIQEVDIDQLKEVEDLGSKFEYQHTYKQQVEFKEEPVSLEDKYEQFEQMRQELLDKVESGELDREEAEEILERYRLSQAELAMLNHIKTLQGEREFANELVAKDAREKAAEALKVFAEENPDLLAKYPDLRSTLQDVYSQELDTELHESKFLGFGSGADHEDLYHGTVELAKLDGLSEDESKLFAKYLMQEAGKMSKNTFAEMVDEKGHFDHDKFADKVAEFREKLSDSDLPGDKWEPRMIESEGTKEVVLVHKGDGGNYEYQTADGEVKKVSADELKNLLAPGSIESEQAPVREEMEVREEVDDSSKVEEEQRQESVEQGEKTNEGEQVKHIEREGINTTIKQESEVTTDSQGQETVVQRQQLESYISGEAAQKIYRISREIGGELVSDLRSGRIDSADDLVARIREIKGEDLSSLEQKQWEVMYKSYEQNPNSPSLQKTMEIQITRFLAQHPEVIDRLAGESGEVEVEGSKQDADEVSPSKTEETTEFSPEQILAEYSTEEIMAKPEMMRALAPRVEQTIWDMAEYIKENQSEIDITDPEDKLAGFAKLLERLDNKENIIDKFLQGKLDANEKGALQDVIEGLKKGQSGKQAA